MGELTELLVAFDDDDQFFSNGLWALLCEIFGNMGVGLRKIYDLSENSSLSFADIYVSKFNAGLEKMCRPEFKYRKKGGLLIAISQGANPPQLYGLPVCLQSSVFLRRTESTESIRNRIAQAWHALHSYPSLDGDVCHYCDPVHLTTAERRISHYLYNQFSVSRIADILQISPKTISTYKRNIMTKFNLNTYSELMAFIEQWNSYEHIRVRKQPDSPCLTTDFIDCGDQPIKQQPFISSIIEGNQMLKQQGIAHTSNIIDTEVICSHVEVKNDDDTTSPSEKKTNFNAKKENVLNALRKVCRQSTMNRVEDGRPNPHCWPKTRDIADECADSVYVTRYWLGILEKEGAVTSSQERKGSRSGGSLHWYPADNKKSIATFFLNKK